MAWFQNLAGKAEDLLNKIDQNAATVLHESTSKLMDISSIIIEPTEYESNDQNVSLQYLDENRRSSLKNENVLDSADEEVLNINDNASVNTSRSFGNEHSTPSKSPKKKESSPFESFGVPVKVFEREIRTDCSNLSSKSGSILNSGHLNDDYQAKLDERILKLEAEKQEISHQMLNIQHLYSETKNENASLQTQLDRANEIVAAAKNEMEQYKARAHRILQEKEKLIMFKKEDSIESEESVTVLSTYNEEIKKELEFQQEKNRELMEKSNNLNAELIAIQQELVFTHNNNYGDKQALQNMLSTEKKYKIFAEEECRMKSEEIQKMTIDMALMEKLIKDKNKEFEDLKQKLKARESFKMDCDVESRLQSLTQTLMAKQHTVETVTSERNALRIQLDKLENEYHKQLQTHRTQMTLLNMNDTDDGLKDSWFVAAKSQVPKLTVVSPLDAGVTRRVKHTFSTLDAISIRTGVFLRRYPVARIFVFCYMILLHIWVLIILFTYVPIR